MAALGKLTLRNYRCFNWENPAVLEFGEGFTAFVGLNNSGKSTALRSIYELRNMLGHIPHLLLPANNFFAAVQPNGVSDPAEVANDSDPTRFHFSIEIIGAIPPEREDQLLAVEILFEFDVRSHHLAAKHVRAIDHKGAIRQFEEAWIRTATGQTTPNVVNYPDGNLRLDYSELHAFAIELVYSRYFPAFRNAINEGAGNHYDLPVGTALVQTWDQWKAGNNRAQKSAISRVEKEIASLLGFETLQINADHSGKTLDVIIDDRPQKLYEVGAGIAQLIIVLAAALVNKPPYILIDEPELNLHPSLQLNFLTTLASYAQKGLLYSTHSIGLARSTARIFAVRRIKNGSSQMYPFCDQVKNFGEWLGELSYSSRVDLGCEGLLLVEGPTEVLCFQEFLRKIGKDQKYVVMQLGGSSLIRSGVTQQLAELSRIVEPSKIRVFIDSERNSADEKVAADRSAFVSDCASIGICAQLSERKATENYFEGKGISKALGGIYQPLENYQRLKDGPTPWRKSDNWRIARETDFEDIKDTDLGKFLASL